jgi:hypothetical protein
MKILNSVTARLFMLWLLMKMSECPNLHTNLQECSCTYSCDLKGRCCECIRNHREHDELPACYFPKEAEKTYDRSIKKFLSIHK